MTDWNTAIIEEFRANDGRVGGNFKAHRCFYRTPSARDPVSRERIPWSTDVRATPTSCSRRKQAPRRIPTRYHNLIARPDVEPRSGTETVADRRVAEGEDGIACGPHRSRSCLASLTTSARRPARSQSSFSNLDEPPTVGKCVYRHVQGGFAVLAPSVPKRTRIRRMGCASRSRSSRRAGSRRTIARSTSPLVCRGGSCRRGARVRAGERRTARTAEGSGGRRSSSPDRGLWREYRAKPCVLMSDARLGRLLPRLGQVSDRQ